MNITVFVEEEYGYREWLWYPNMTEEELKKWWKNLDTVDAFFFSGAASMPGNATEIMFDIVDNEIIYKNEDGTDITLPEGCWSAHIHEDDDSWLKSSDGEIILHSGYEKFSSSGL